MTPEVDPATVELILRLGRALHRYGASAPRLEEALQVLCRRFALEGQFFSTPTAIISGFGTDAVKQAYLTRVDPGEVNLEKLAELHELLGAIRSGDLSVAEAAARLDAILAAPSRSGSLVIVLAYATVSATAARFLQGGLAEVLVAASIGLLTGLLALATARSEALARVFPPLAAIVAAVAAVAANQLVTPVSVYLAMLAGLILLIPGLSLTVSMQELATRHLISGTARLAGAFVVFVNIGFGIAVGSQLAQIALGEPAEIVATPLPPWTALVAVAVAPLGLSVILRARPRDLGFVFVGAAVAYAGVQLGRALVGPQLGVFFGTFFLGLASNWLANRRDMPTAVPYVPGLLMLVPGSIGFQSLSALLARNVVPGVEAAFSMIMVAMALVAGMLVAAVVVPPRRTL